MIRNLPAWLSVDTDIAWERLARADPYHSVKTDPRFRRGAMTDADRHDFFAAGLQHVATLMHLIHQQRGEAGAPIRRVLDFGCGVGRMLSPFAALADEVVGVDASATMLAEARRNCSHLTNLRLADSFHGLGSFDLIHSYTVFQHIPVRRGLRLLRQLVRTAAPGGVMAIHVTYGRTASPVCQLVHTLRARVPGVNAIVNALQGRRPGEPMMQMNRYDLHAVQRVLGPVCSPAYWTCHGQHLGVMLLAYPAAMT